MTSIDWFFDPISPFAWLQWPAVRRLAAQHAVQLRPVLFAGILEANGQLGPAEIPAKRLFTYRHAQWRADQAGRTMRFPPAHPFNSLGALRLCLVADCTPDAVEVVLDWIWQEGRALDTPESIEALGARLGIADASQRCSDDAVRAALRRNGDEALQRGVFGVPTLVIDGELFWGEDATTMALAYLGDPTMFEHGEYPRLRDLPIAATRKP